MMAYRRYVLVNLIVIGCYTLFWVASLAFFHFGAGVTIGAALLTLASMTILYVTRPRQG